MLNLATPFKVKDQFVFNEEKEFSEFVGSNLNNNDYPKTNLSLKSYKAWYDKF